MNHDKFKQITSGKQLEENSSHKNSPKSSKRERESLDNLELSTKKFREVNSSQQKSTMSTEMQQMQKLIQESFAKAEKRQEELLSRLRFEINSDIQSIKESFQAQVDNLSTRISSVDQSSRDELMKLKNEINLMNANAAYTKIQAEQCKRENDVIARGLPAIYFNNHQELISKLNEKFKCNLTPQSVSIEGMKPKAKYPTSTFFFKFSTKAHKIDFMKSVHTFRKNDIIPIEDVFESFIGTNQAGKEITFRNSLTKQTKALLDAALAERRANRLASAYERGGVIFMKKQHDDQPIEAISINQIRQFAT
jgi:hypothetical protein